MNVLFVYPNVDSQVGFNYGVASLAAVLREAGHGVSLFNLNDKLAPIPGDDEFIESVGVRFSHGVDGYCSWFISSGLCPGLWLP